jgi:hypothetical protein
MATRVGSSNMLKTWSISTGSGRAAVSGIVAPGSKPLVELPRSTSRYLSPRADFDRTTMVEFSGSGWMSLLSSMLTLATSLVHWRVGSLGQGASLTVTGSTVLICPTRTPPIRTSLPGTRVSALGSSAESL